MAVQLESRYPGKQYRYQIEGEPPVCDGQQQTMGNLLPLCDLNEKTALFIAASFITTQRIEQMQDFSGCKEKLVMCRNKV